MSPAGQPPSPHQPPPHSYIPTQYLLSRTGLSRDDFLSLYQAFRQSIQHVETAPELVFEILIGNFNDAFNGALSQERAQHAAVQEALRSEKITLQADLARATAAIARAERVRLSAPAAIPIPATIVPVVTPNQTYLQFWFDNSNQRFTEKRSTGVWAATSPTPVPYGIASGWAGADIIRTCKGHGSYDSRMDPLTTGLTVPLTVTHLVVFERAFSTPPKVVVWLTGLSAATGDAVSVRATANNITETEFALQINSSGGARLGSVGVAWAVWPEVGNWQQLPVEVGSVSTITPGEARLPKLAATGTLAQVALGTVLLVAVSAVDLVLTGNLWVDVAVLYCSGGYDGTSTWSMAAGPANARVYSARVVYVSR